MEEEKVAEVFHVVTDCGQFGSSCCGNCYTELCISEARKSCPNCGYVLVWTTRNVINFGGSDF